MYTAEEPDYDDDADGNWYQCGTITYYANTVNHQLAWSMEDAISDVVEWLTSESVGDRCGNKKHSKVLRVEK